MIIRGANLYRHPEKQQALSLSSAVFKAGAGRGAGEQNTYFLGTCVSWRPEWWQFVLEMGEQDVQRDQLKEHLMPT